MSNILGIDVGLDTTKVVSLSKKDEKVVLDLVGEIKTPRVDWRKGEKKEIDEVAEAIKKLLADLKCKSKQVVVCLPEDQIISRLVRLPPLKETEIKEVLKFEAETFVPYPLDQVSIDYEILERDDAGRLTLFVIAAKNDLIQNYVKLFKAVDLELIALESPAIAMKRLINLSTTAVDGVMIVDIGEKYSDLLGIKKGNIFFTRSIPFGGEALTRAISISLGLDMDSAEEYKKAYGIKESELEGKIRTAVMPVFNNISDEIRKAMSLFLEDFGQAINLLVLSGGGANMPGLAEELNRLLGVEVQVISPFIKIDTTKFIVPFDIKLEGCRFGLAVGLALRGLV